MLKLAPDCRHVFGAIVLFCAASLACFSGTLHADTPQPIVAVDLFHYNILSLRPQSTWRMVMLRNELVAGGYAIREINEPMTSEALSGCSVLLVTRPNVYYSDTELTAISAFVSAGGGVFFGANYGVLNGYPTSWAPACQSFANVFGVTLDNNNATDPLHNVSGYPYWITFGSSCIGSHPVDTGISSLQCYATTTIAPSTGATAVASTDSDAVPPLRPAIVAKAYQSGRVLIAGSSFYLADPVPNVNLGTVTADMLGLTAAGNRRFAYNAVTWLAGAAGRPLVTVTTVPPAIVYDSLSLVGTVCDAQLAQYVLEYAPVADQSVWTQVGPVHGASVINDALGTWDVTGVAAGDYVLRVRATNSTAGQYSVNVPVRVDHPQALSTISEVAGLPVGTLVSLSDKCVVAGSDDLVGRIYLEEDNRSNGIAVITTAAAPRGSRVSVIGTIGLDSGIRAINALNVTVQQPQGPIPAPLGVTNRSAGSAIAGLGTTGVLVKTWGKVISSDASGFIIDDGSCPGGLRVVTGYGSSAITPPDTEHVVSVVGIGASDGGAPAVVTRTSTDVQILR